MIVGRLGRNACHKQPSFKRSQSQPHPPPFQLLHLSLSISPHSNFFHIFLQLSILSFEGIHKRYPGPMTCPVTTCRQTNHSLHIQSYKQITHYTSGSPCILLPDLQVLIFTDYMLRYADVITVSRELSTRPAIH